MALYSLEPPLPALPLYSLEPALLALTHPQAGGGEAGDEFFAGDGQRTLGDEGVAAFVGIVVVVVVEPALGNAGGARESVQLVEGRVAHEVPPEPPVGGPDGVVDEHSHSATEFMRALVLMR